MADTEKVTINMSVVDLGQVDLLVEEGFYSSRTDFIRTAIRNQLNTHSQEVHQAVTRKAMAIGAFVYNRRELEEKRAAHEHLVVKAIGLLHIADDVPPELAQEVFQSIEVLGVFHASTAVREALADRTKAG
jgi:Predicted transcriptional regulators containing the CopG/Arc/MetJ DNA-binding domain and a metal-binding domain